MRSKIGTTRSPSSSGRNTYSSDALMNEYIMQRARSLHQAGRIVEAADLYQQILLADPTQFEAFYSLGMICVQTGQLEEAHQLMANAMILNPTFAEGWCARGIVLLQLRNREEALWC